MSIVRKLVTTPAREFLFSDVVLPELPADAIRVRVSFAAPKHGTELHAIGGSVFDEKTWDPELRLFLPRGENDPAPSPPTTRGLGNMVVGNVVAVGSDVTEFTVGDEVFGYGQVQEAVQGPASKWRALGDLSEQTAVCVDPAHVAFVAVRDGLGRIGDSVAIFGLGAIGLMAVQLAKAGGARGVFAVDPVARRRDAALLLGADAVFDPTAVDSALQIKLATRKAGADVAIETSGNARAFQDAIRCVRQCGTIVHVPWGPKDPVGLRFDAEFHLNRPTIVGSQGWEGWGNADRDHPRWTPARAWDATVELCRAGFLSGERVVDPVIAFDDAPREMAALLADPRNAIKVGIRFQGNVNI